MASSDIIKIGFDYRSSLAQFEKDTDGVFDGISNKAGKQKITIQLDAKDDKVIDKIKELQKLKLDKFTFEFGDSGLKEQLQTFDKLENKINEIINLSKGIDLSFNTKNKTDAYNQLKKYADAFKDYYGNEEAMATNAGAKAGYAYYKAYEEALRKGVAQSKLEKVTIDFDVNDSIFSKERIVENRIKEFENFQKYGNADENNLIAEITLLENRLLKFNSAYSQVKANLGDAPITPEITKNIKNYVRLLEVAENRATDAELFGFSSEDINSDKDLANMYLDFAKEDATAENKKYIESLKQQETQAISTAEAEQKLAEAQKETVSNTSNSNNSQIEELKSDIQEVKTELGDVTSLVQKFTQAFREYITAYEDYYGGNPGLSSFGIEKAGNTLTSLEKKYPELKSVRSNGYVNTSDDDLYNKALNEYLKRQDKLQSELKETEIQAEQTSLAVKEVITTTPKEDLKDAFPDKDISASVESATNSIKEENNVLEQNTQKVKENTQAKEQNANIDFSKYDKRLDSYNGKIDKYKTTIDRFNDGGWTSDAYLKNVQAVKNAVDEYETLLKELKGKDASLVTSEDISKLDNYEKKIKDTIATVTNMSAAEKGYKFEAGQKELDKIHKLLNENSRMSSDAKAKIKAYYKEIESGNPSMSLDRIHGEIMKIYNAEVEAGRAGRTLWDTLKNSRLHQMAAQLAGMFSIYDVINVVKEGINTVRELDTAMVEVEKVSDETEQSYANFRKTVSETATEIASTNKELLNSSADFLRLGYDINQASDLAKNATLFVNVGDGVDINEATEDMITAMKAFDIQAKDSIKIVDDYNQIGNLYALSATDIGEAMKRSASALETGNNTFEESIGLITAMNEIVQNSENTGNTLKVLSLRLRGAKAELESMSEDTDGLCDSTSKLREQIQALTGVDIMVDDNTFKSTADIIKELGAVWNNLTDSSQAATLEIIAGKTRANNVAALLKNYQQIDNVMQDLGDAEGSAEKENAAIVDSVEGRLKQLSASMESMWSTLLDSDALKTGISFLTSLVEGATNFVDVLDQIHAIIPSIIGLIGGLSFEKITNNTLDYI